MTNTTTRRPALGKGLSALIPGKSGGFDGVATVKETVSDGKPLEIALELIDPSPYQTRSRMNEAELDDLSRSIIATGVVQPIIVRPLASGRFQLIAGERRWRASQMAGKTTIPAVVRQVSDEQAMEMTIVENLQRSDLNPMEQARAYERLSREFKLTQEQMSLRTGKDRPTVANFLRLLKLPLGTQGLIEIGKLSFGHGKVLLALEDGEQLQAMVEKIINEDLSVRQAGLLVQEMLNPENKPPKKTISIQMIDPNVKEALEQMQRILGLKVRIEDKNNRGRVIIHYSNIDDFDTIISALLK